MKTTKQIDAIKAVCDLTGSRWCDWIGSTYRELLEAAESNSAIVYWGCWSNLELEETI